MKIKTTKTLTFSKAEEDKLDCLKLWPTDSFTLEGLKNLLVIARRDRNQPFLSEYEVKRHSTAIKLLNDARRKLQNA